MIEPPRDQELALAQALLDFDPAQRFPGSAKSTGDKRPVSKGERLRQVQAAPFFNWRHPVQCRGAHAA